MKKNDKTPKTKTTDSERETRVLLERIHSDVKIIAEGQTSNSQRLDRIESAVSELGGLKSDVEMIKVAVMDTNQRVKTIEKKLDNHETRIIKVEEKVFV
jgi:ribosome assembly protein YihI (activator of Der GTPase)